jgi:hypothetical protein
MRSQQTFNIKGRGIVKILKLSDIDETYRVGDRILIDGTWWNLKGVEMTSSPQKEDIGVIVEPEEVEENKKYLSIGDKCPTCQKVTPCEHHHSDYFHNRCGTSPCSCDDDYDNYDELRALIEK